MYELFIHRIRTIHSSYGIWKVTPSVFGRCHLPYLSVYSPGLYQLYIVYKLFIVYELFIVYKLYILYELSIEYELYILY